LRERVLRRRGEAARFIEQTSPQSDEDFLSEIVQDALEKHTATALGVRRAIARFGCVAPTYIRAEATFKDLEALPNWSKRIDAYFDNIRLCRLLEIHVGRAFPTRMMEVIPDPESNMTLTVGQFAKAIVGHFARE
jgi:hypothetical protein